MDTTAVSPPPPIATSFRAAMRRIASTVTIVTASDGERRHGMTMTAVSSLSMDPPSMIVCVNQNTFLHDILMSARLFCKRFEPRSGRCIGRIQRSHTCSGAFSCWRMETYSRRWRRLSPHCPGQRFLHEGGGSSLWNSHHLYR